MWWVKGVLGEREIIDMCDRERHTTRKEDKKDTGRDNERLINVYARINIYIYIYACVYVYPPEIHVFPG